MKIKKGLELIKESDQYPRENIKEVVTNNKLYRLPIDIDIDWPYDIEEEKLKSGEIIRQLAIALLEYCAVSITQDPRTCSTLNIDKEFDEDGKIIKITTTRVSNEEILKQIQEKLKE